MYRTAAFIAVVVLGACAPEKGAAPAAQEERTASTAQPTGPGPAAPIVPTTASPPVVPAPSSEAMPATMPARGAAPAPRPTTAPPAAPVPTPPAPPVSAAAAAAAAAPPPAAPPPVAAPPAPSESRHTVVGPDKCKMCHKIQYDSWAASPHQAKGVDCETCHGPGSDYKAAAIMKNRAEAVKNGLLLPEIGFCKKCHPKADADLFARVHAHKAR